MSKPFFSGLEEATARIAALFINFLFFTIFMLSRGQNLNLDWIGVIQLLSVFWLLYEIVGLVLFEMFKFFSKRMPESAPQPTPPPAFTEPEKNSTTGTEIGE